MENKVANGEPGEGALTLPQVISSVAASFFGVQSSRNRARDFKRGNPLVFIAVGFGMTGMVALGFLGAVQLALRFAGHG